MDLPEVCCRSFGYLLEKTDGAVVEIAVQEEREARTL